jgi:hypothetical protein
MKPPGAKNMGFEMVYRLINSSKTQIKGHLKLLIDVILFQFD